MFQCALQGCRFQLLLAPGPERSARCSQRQPVNVLGVVVLETLEQRAMLTIHRNDGGIELLCRRGKNLCSRHQAFLVGKGDGGALLYPGQGGLEAVSTNDCAHDHVDRARCRLDDGLLACRHLNAGTSKSGLEILQQAGVCGHRKLCIHLSRVCSQLRDVAIGNQRFNLEPVRVVTDDVNGGLADRAC
jgi:hypothetical protein